VEVQLTLSSRPCYQLLNTVTAAESMEDYFLLMRGPWCVLEVKAEVDVRETVVDRLFAMRVEDMS